MMHFLGEHDVVPFSFVERAADSGVWLEVRNWVELLPSVRQEGRDVLPEPEGRTHKIWWIRGGEFPWEGCMLRIVVVLDLAQSVACREPTCAERGYERILLKAAVGWLLTDIRQRGHKTCQDS